MADETRTEHEKQDVVPYHRKPEELTLEDWQIQLRRQFVRNREFTITRVEGDGHPVFRDYIVHNPESGGTYKVAIRDNAGEMNFCECLDFKTNHLGTCKHIEAVLLAIKNNEFQDDDDPVRLLKEDYIPPYTSLYLQYGETRRVKIRIGTDHAAEYLALAREFFDTDMVLKPESYARFEELLRRARDISEEFRCYDDALSRVLELRAAAARRELMENRYQSDDAFQDLLNATLYPYQIEGIRTAFAAGRSLIADEMGLGKTIQAIGTAELLRKEELAWSVLIVCPTSLKYQWYSEISKFTDSPAIVIEGPPARRPAQYQDPSSPYKIVSYHTVKRDIDVINRLAPDLVILDEAQRIKNWKTQLARMVKRIGSTYTTVLTGTPVENNLEELYSIVQFIDPFRLGPYHRFLDRYLIRDETGKVTGYRGLKEVGEAIADFTVRRTKREVLSQLPERTDKVLYVSMTQAQMDLHDSYQDAVARLVHKWRRLGHLPEQERQRLLISLNMMRMACDSTYIIDQDPDNRHDMKIAEVLSIIEELAASAPEASQKAVVFSQWERMTRLVAVELDRRGIGYAYLHGGIPSKNRKDLYERFNTDDRCLVFLSTDAGGTGLNLQSASVMVNLDIPWNPAVLEQRIARIHRIGQRRNVTIVNLVSSGTIEERMLSLLQFKSDLAAGILDEGEDSIFMDSGRYRKFMDTVGTLVKRDTAEQADDRPAEEQEERELREDTRTGDISADEGRSLARGRELMGELEGLLRDTDTAKALLSSMITTDESGSSFLKIPVTSEEEAATTLRVLGRLFSTAAPEAEEAP
ncbi:MAG: DEAD/DEAH box helicase [Alkalispirochaeta sp.]